MYNIEDGSYSYTIEKFNKEKIYHLECTYYLKYNSSKGLFAINKLHKNYETDIQEKCLYYHDHLDLLFESVGMIINRFKPQKQAGKKLKIQAQSNCIEYGYNKLNYPLLNDKSFRNFIEHIDERDRDLIEKYQYFGTFNLIYSGMDNQVKNELLANKRKQNNLLNLEDLTYTILEIENNNIVEKKISIKELENELNKINQISNTIWNYINSKIWDNE